MFLNLFCYKVHYPAVYTSTAETISQLINYSTDRKVIANYLENHLSHKKHCEGVALGSG